MKIIKQGLLLIAGIFAGIMCIVGVITLFVLLCSADFEEGKSVVIFIFLLLITGFGFAAFKCLKSVFHKEKTIRNQETIEHPVMETPVHTATEPVYDTVPVTPVPEQVSVPQPAPVMAKVQRQEVPRQVLSDMRVKNIPKCNCDGCPKQEECEYGHIVYDEITKERLSLFDKFMMTFEHSESINNPDVASIEAVHDKRLLLNLELSTLKNTLTYLLEQKENYLRYGKCGRAYFNYMKMGDEISLVKEAIREYDEYQTILKQKDLVKSYVLNRLNEEEFIQEELYKIFSDVERKNVTSAIRELEKLESIVREKHGKTYIIHKK